MRALTLKATSLAFVLVLARSCFAADENPLLGGGVFDILDKGGPVMILILSASVLGLALAFERMVSLRRRRLCPPELISAVQRATESGDLDSLLPATEAQSPLARILNAGLRWRSQGSAEMEKAMESVAAQEIGRLRRPVRPIAILASIMPLLGLLGTILGMISTFNMLKGVSASDRVETLAPGIGQALYTTAAGLSVAIPFLIAYHFLSSQLNRAASEWSILGTNLALAASSEEKAREEAAS